MATKIISPQMTMARRQMGSSIAARKFEVTKSPKAEVSLLPNGLKITSMDSDSTAGLSTVGVLVKSGSSYESYDNLGVSHALRRSVGLSTKNVTSFGLVRNIQQMGGTINVVGSREYTLYTLTTLRPKLSEAIDFLREVVTSPKFMPWELSDSLYGKMSAEVKGLSGTALAMELLHKAAFRHGLGNSLYAPEFMIGGPAAPKLPEPAPLRNSLLGTSALKEFHSKTHTFTRTVLAGHGVDHATLLSLSRNFNLAKGHGPSHASKYFGGEARKDCGGDLVTIAIGGESTPASNVKEAMAFTILGKIMGSGPVIKRGSLSGKLGKAVSKIEGQKAVGGFNVAYQNTGLAGAVVICEASIASNVLSEVVGTLRSLSVTEEEVLAAQKALTLENSEAMRNGGAVVEILSTHALNEVDFDSDIIHSVSAKDVNVAAMKLASSKLSMSALGNLKNVPYLDTL